MSKFKKILLIILPLVLFYVFCLPRQLFKEPLSATLYARDGSLLGARISSGGQWYFPPADKVPDKFATCIINYEDRRFRYHAGVDLISVGRALRQNVRKGEVVSGASTLTMQVIRLSRPDAPRTVPEKIYEMILATRLELRCSKRKILLLYASNAPFGGNVVGLEAAARRYFGKDAGDLSWAESAMLAVLPNSPSLIHLGRNRADLFQKRNALLDKLMSRGVIDSVECFLAKDEPLPDKPGPMPDYASHLLEKCIRSGGAKAYHSTIDCNLQLKVNDIARRHFEWYHTNLVDNMGILVVDIHTGEIKAYYGNTKGCAPAIRGADVDMIPARRSSGSTLKPLLYAAMLQSGEILPSSLVKDTPFNGKDFSPQNFNRSFEGAVPANEVIERSLNVPSVRMLERYGTDRFLKLLQQTGFSTITKDASHYGLSLILGGAEISLHDLARAYYYMAAELGGDPLREDFSFEAGAPRGTLVKGSLPIGKAAAWLTFDALSNANRPEEESSWMDFTSGRKIAWKTGTSWGNRDAWSVGVTPDYVVAVWVGNSDGEGRAQMTGVSYASPVMFDVFSALPASSWFSMPKDGMSRVEVCSASGLPASDICPKRDTVWAPDISQRPDLCRYHRIVHLDAEGLYQVNSNCCPVDEMRTEVRFVLPPAQEWYYMKKHLDYKQLPPKHPLYDSASSGFNPIEIIYPSPGTTIVVTRGLDGSRQGAVFKAAHTDAGAVLYWHLDGEYLGQTASDHEMTLAPSQGKHRLTVMDSQGFSRSISFTVR